MDPWDDQNPDEEGWAIRDPAAADWAVRLIARHRAELAEAEELYRHRKAQLDNWLAAQRRRCEQAEERMRDHLLRWLAGTGKSTARLPAGRVTVRNPRPSWAVNDKERLLAVFPDLGRVRVDVDPKKLAGLRLVGDKVVNPETGETVPAEEAGITLEVRPPGLAITFNKDEEEE